ncbi:lysoplasmalogenase [Sinimarinibacterium sp. NLF-5-8]|uniref:lysoplasmalogenase n=1 Tax=Sinimarinibacterium sp. NLF-5-8 TaxID=2698684 RepID=UPI00137BA6BF|nr:lysoplasmalogenase [Sinimarinibacterium sp. NLF-5-8]QHS10619.1 lysoplasmalogenase [Sinimarinibacterium sp. NLF-5-8]
MLMFFSVSAVICALLAIYADRNEARPPIFWLLKPLTTVLIIGAASQAPDSGYRTLLLLGLGWSLIGDIALVMTSDRAFLLGLSSFLIAHLLFIPAFLLGLPSLLPPWWSAVFVLVSLGFSALLLPRAGALKIPVLVYGAVLVAMAVAAAARWDQLGHPASLYGLLGASLFLVSDSALGIRQFVRFYRHAQPLILSTYWSAIGLMTASAFF